MDFKELQKECFLLTKEDWTISTKYPNIGILANEFEKEILPEISLLELGKLLVNNKIALIKEIRRRYGKDLAEAKKTAEVLIELAKQPEVVE